MKYSLLLLPTALCASLISCTNPASSDDIYDTGDPYGVADYGDPYTPSADVNPSYDIPLYEDTTPASTPSSRPSTPSRPATSAAKVHTIVRGDTLWGLSKKYNVPVASIKRANNMTSDTVVLGRKLTIPAN